MSSKDPKVSSISTFEDVFKTPLDNPLINLHQYHVISSINSTYYPLPPTIPLVSSHISLPVKSIYFTSVLILIYEPPTKTFGDKLFDVFDTSLFGADDPLEDVDLSKSIGDDFYLKLLPLPWHLIYLMTKVILTQRRNHFSLTRKD